MEDHEGLIMKISCRWDLV